MIDTLTSAGLLREKRKNTAASSTPWYLKILHAFSGWLASIFLLMTLGALIGKLFRTPSMMLAGGVLLIVSAYLLLTHTHKTLFLEHTALSISLAGQALITLALFQWVGSYSFHSPVSWFGLALLELILMVIMPDYLHRVFSAGVFAFALLYGMHFAGAGALMVPVLLGMTVWLWLHEYADAQTIFARQAIGWGWSLALFWSAAAGHRIDPFRYAASHTAIGLDHPWIGALGSGIVLIALVHLLAKGATGLSPTHRIMALLFVVLIAGLSTRMPGLSVAVTLLIVGFSRGNLPLMGLAVATLLWAIGSFYYALHTTLLIKSALLVAGGLLLLILYALLRYLTDTEGRQ